MTVNGAVESLLLVVREQDGVEGDVDIGMVPSHGLVPPTLRISDLESCKISETNPNYRSASPAARCCCPNDVTSINRQVNSQVRSNLVTRLTI